MKQQVLLICLSSFVLSACSAVSVWFEKEKTAIEKQDEPKSTPHPVGVTYEITSSKGDRKQLSVFYNGEGLARVLFPQNGNSKFLIDYTKQEITNKDFNTDWQESKTLDPYSFPSILDSQSAIKRKAVCIGSGRSKGFPYHRWSYQNRNDEWEVWTDDNDSFPVYFRSIKDGEVTTWTIVNAWIDGSTYDKPTFFTLDPDPQPAPKAEEEAEQSTDTVSLKHKKHAKHKHSQKKSAKKQALPL